VTLPSPAEVENAEWPALKAFAAELGLNPKGRSGIVRQRVLDHLRVHGAPQEWRAGRPEVAALLTRIGPADLAAELWESTITLDAPAPWVGLGTAYLKADRIEEALKCYDRAISMGDAGARLHKAQALMRAGRRDAAIAQIDEALGGSPGTVRAWAMRAALAEAGGDLEETVASYREIEALGRGRLGLAKVLMRAGRFEEAETVLYAHLSDQPDDAVAWNNHGVCLARRSRWKDAAESFRRAVVLDPRGAAAQNNHAVALAGADRVDDALKRIAAARRITEDPRILLNEAALWERKGEPATARPVYARVLEVAPGHPEAVAGKRRVAPKARTAKKGRSRSKKAKPEPTAVREASPKSRKRAP
jgi:tetratricopeptide (TPR) repeat protein